MTAQRAADANAQRRCGLMFELSVNLERLLEFLASQLPAAFRCASSVEGRDKPTSVTTPMTAAKHCTSPCGLCCAVSITTPQPCAGVAAHLI